MYDVVIIGGGPAGLSTAIYATRANLSTIVIESEAMGGKLSKTYEIENYPGFVKIGGGDLAADLYNHAQSFGAVIRNGIVKKIVNGKIKKVLLEGDEEIEARSVIIATGTKEKHLEVPQSEEYTGRGISYCAVCDGFFYRKKDIVIVGGGNSALEEALYLSTIVNKVYIVIRRDVFRADASVIEKVKANEKIEIITKHLPKELVTEEGKITGLMIENVDTGETKTISCSGIFPYIGAVPNTSFIDLDILDERGYIITDKDMKTKVEGIYAAGDVIQKDLRQVVTATNDGAIAANAVAKYLKQ
ncbi:MAG: thioredoxin-disulfide reductase [Erysipelotrichaceae bacterium]|nr:thioredoxin-disulfide reductase [Erysipelotrichaceae bacterium]